MAPRLPLKPKRYPLHVDPTASFAQSSKIEMAIFGLLHGRVFLNMTESLSLMSPVKQVRHGSFLFWKIEKEIFGSLLLVPGYIITMGNPFGILRQKTDLPVMGLLIFMKIKPVIFGSVPEAGQAVTTGNHFAILK